MAKKETVDIKFLDKDIKRKACFSDPENQFISPAAKGYNDKTKTMTVKNTAFVKGLISGKQIILAEDDEPETKTTEEKK